MLRLKHVCFLALLAVLGLGAGSCGGPLSESTPPPETEVPGPVPTAVPAPAPPNEGPNEAPSAEAVLGEVARLRDQLPWANAALSAPETLKVGESGTVRFSISLQRTLDALEGELREKGGSEKLKTFTDRVQISHVVQATLRGEPAITVAPLGEEERAIGGADEEWIWRVKAVEAGNQILTLTLSAVVEVDNKSRKLVLKTFEREILVQALPQPNPVLKFLRDNLTWVIGTLLLPALLAGWRFLKARRKTE